MGPLLSFNVTSESFNRMASTACMFRWSFSEHALEGQHNFSGLNAKCGSRTRLLRLGWGYHNLVVFLFSQPKKWEARNSIRCSSSRYRPTPSQPNDPSPDTGTSGSMDNNTRKKSWLLHSGNCPNQKGILGELFAALLPSFLSPEASRKHPRKPTCEKELWYVDVQREPPSKTGKTLAPVVNPPQDKTKSTSGGLAPAARSIPRRSFGAARHQHGVVPPHPAPLRRVERL